MLIRKRRRKKEYKEHPFLYLRKYYKDKQALELSFEIPDKYLQNLFTPIGILYFYQTHTHTNAEAYAYNHLRMTPKTRCGLITSHANRREGHTCFYLPVL